jgi:hypothetical protein
VLKRMLMVIGATLGLVAIAAPVVQAGAPGGTSVSTNANQYQPGQTAIVSATGFTACIGAQITFLFGAPGQSPDVTLTSTVDALGNATVNFPVPNIPGNWVVDASAAGCTPASDTFVVNRPTYPPAVGTQVSSSATTYPPGGSATLTATGFVGCATTPAVVTFTITPPGGGTPIVLTATANSSGVATVTLTLPDTIGTYQVLASSPGCPDATSSFVVRILPTGGANSNDSVRTAAIVVALGVGLVLVAWRRRSRIPATA